MIHNTSQYNARERDRERHWTLHNTRVLQTAVGGEMQDNSKSINSASFIEGRAFVSV